MNEYGLFSDEGLVEDGFYDVEVAKAALATYDPDDDLHVAEICPEHHEHERDYCEECNADEENEQDE